MSDNCTYQTWQDTRRRPLYDRHRPALLRPPRALRLLGRGLRRRHGQGLLRDGDGPAGRYSRRRLRLSALPDQAGLPAEGDVPDGQQLADAGGP